MKSMMQNIKHFTNTKNKIYAKSNYRSTKV